MKIDQFTLDGDGQFLTASARVRFEDAPIGETRVFIKTLEEYGEGFWANPDAFLTGCLPPALHLGEKRIKIDGGICPFLKEGLGAAMALFS
ncbi:MAG: hypothetical protein MI749_13745, partial [Desulfovibrionales bacterium]|nr:hypothetical protein [Desulfovibrionales bacterium]